MGQAPPPIVLGSSSSAPETFMLLSMDSIVVPEVAAAATKDAVEHLNATESLLPNMMPQDGVFAAPPAQSAALAPAAAPASATLVPPPPAQSAPPPHVDLTSGMADLFMSFTSPLVRLGQRLNLIILEGWLEAYF